MNTPPPGRVAQFALGAIAIAAIAFTFSPRQPDVGRPLIPPARRTRLPDFTMNDLHGAPWSLSSRSGHIVLVNFWATWCPPCREEIPDMVRLAKSEPDLEIAGIAMDSGADGVVRRFVKSFGIPYPILVPSAPSAFVDSVQSLPTTFLVDAQGRVAQGYFTAISERAIRNDLKLLRAESRNAGE